jgi:WD40 repeat protein
VTLSAALLVADLAAGAPVPAALATSTVQAGLLCAAGNLGLVGGASAGLAKAILRSMKVARLKVLGLVVLIVGVAAAGVGGAWCAGGSPPSEEPSRNTGTSPAAPDPPAPPTDAHGDRLPTGALFRLGTLRFRHGGQHGGLLTYSPDGTVLVSAHGDGVIHFWEAATGREIRSVQTGRHCFADGPAALSPGGKLVALPVGNVIDLWDLTMGKELHHDIGHGTNTAPRVAFSPDGKLAATGSTDGARLWHTATGRELCRFQGYQGEMACLTFAPDGNTLVGKGRDGKVILWDAANGKDLRQWDGNPGSQSDLGWSPDSKLLALGLGPDVALLDAATGREILRFVGLQCTPHSLTFSPDGRTFAATAAASGIHLWSLPTGKRLRQQIDLGDIGVGNLTFSPDGKTLAATGTGSVIRLWDVATGRELHTHEGHQGEVRSAGFSPDGRFLATAGADSAIHVWDMTTGRQVTAWQVQRLTLNRILFSPDGKRLFGSAPNNPVFEWDAVTGKERRRLAIQPDEPKRLNQVQTIALAPDRKLLAVSRSRSNKDEIQLLVEWDLGTGKQQVERLNTGKRADCLFELSSDGTFLAHMDGSTVHVRNLAAGKESFTLQGACDAVHNVAFARDNRTLAGVCLHREVDRLSGERTERRSVVVWELGTGKELHRLDLGKPGMNFGCHVCFSPNGRLLAGGGDGPDVPLRLWDLATGKELLSLGSQRAAVTALAISPDGTKLVSGLRDNTALVWDLTPALQRLRLPAAPSPAQLGQLWADLADDRPDRAHAAVWQLTVAPAQALVLLRERLRPVAAFEEKQLARLLADLESDEFVVRDAASRKLEELGPQAEPALRRALAATPSDDTRRRLESLLAAPGIVRSPATVRRLRAIQVLETIGSQEARQILAELAKGAAAARETRDAKAALERLSGRMGKS